MHFGGDNIIVGKNFSDDFEDDAEEEHGVPSGRKALAVWLGVVAALGFVGNTLVIVVVIKVPKLRTTTNAFITSLAVSDMLLSLTIPWIIVGLVSPYGWPLPSWSCVVVCIVRFTLSGSSVWHLVSIGFNRMFLITTSASVYRKIYNRANNVIILLITWLIPLSTVVVPYASGATIIGYDDHIGLCSDLEERPDGSESRVHTYIAATVLTCIPLAIVLAVYVRIFVFIHRHVRRQQAWRNDDVHCHHHHESSATTTMATTTTTTKMSGVLEIIKEEETNTVNSGILLSEDSNNDCPSVIPLPEPQAAPPTHPQPQKKKKRKNKKTKASSQSLETRITLNTFYVVLGFLVCQIPYGVLALSSGIDYGGVPISQAFLLLNVCINPLIYGAKHPQFRKAFRGLFLARFASSKATPTSS